MTAERDIVLLVGAAEDTGDSGVRPVLHTISLSQLAPEVRRVAAGISSTLPDDPGSLVLVGANQTYRELIENRSPFLPAALVERGVAATRKALGASWLKQQPILPWPWPLLPQGVSAAEYLSTQVEAMLAVGRIEYVWGEPPRWLPASDVAHYLGVSERQVRSLCQEGVFPQVQKHVVWLVPLTDLLDVLAGTRRRPGNAPSAEQEEQAEVFLAAVELGKRANPLRWGAGNVVGALATASRNLNAAAILVDQRGVDFASLPPAIMSLLHRLSVVEVSLPLAFINVDPLVCPPARYDEATLRTYMQTFDALPPIEVWQITDRAGELVLVDGRYRLEAACRLGRTSIVARIEHGTYAEARERARLVHVQRSGAAAAPIEEVQL